MLIGGVMLISGMLISRFYCRCNLSQFCRNDSSDDSYSISIVSRAGIYCDGDKGGAM